MSSDQMSNPSSSRPPGEAPARNRNPVERLVVWGLIVVLLAIAAREAVARFGYTNSLNSLQAAMEADNDGHTLMLDKVPDHVSGMPAREVDEAQRVVTYHWRGLLKDYGSIHLQYSSDNEVLGLLTADAPPEEPIAAVAADDPAAEEQQHDAQPPQISGGEGPGPGGRRQFDPMQFDTDGDGQLSLQEAPERMKARFADIDTNGDGYVDQTELAARRSAQSDRSPAPASADDTPSDAPTTDAPQEVPPEDPSATPATDETPDAGGEQPVSPAEEPAQP